MMPPCHGRPALPGIALALGLAALALGAAAPPRDPTTSGDPSRRAASIRAKNLPDSVLAVIGADRVITAASFVEAWMPAAPPPDSLTPQAARRFLELLIDKEILAAAAVKESWVWTPQESAGYQALRDRLMVAAALDSALRDARESLRATG